MKRLLPALLMLSFVFVPVATYAQAIIPAFQKDFECMDAKGVIDQETRSIFSNNTAFRNHIAQAQDFTDRNQRIQNLLGCGVRSGYIRLFMVPFFVTYLIQFLLGVAGIISVLFIVLGGYFYVLGGLTENKEKGKKTLTHAIIGLLVSLSAWAIVNFVQVILTS